MATAVALSLSLAACGSSGTGEPIAEPVPRLTFHPCDGFGPDARAAAGIDGSEPVRYEDREEPYQSWACSHYSYHPYSSVLVSSNAIPVSKTQNDSRLTLMQDTKIADQACPLALKVAQDLGPYFPQHLSPDSPRTTAPTHMRCGSTRILPRTPRRARR
ncbi:hypothetical protein [Rhodococcus marinonascens]|uniref:hypothetical protein n=1 Tax=Rhodococcus marinonascens TaxID=38311 RepID=UPI0009333614|nr:hypothetical protein [Rhodococcus marinonascens]